MRLESWRLPLEGHFPTVWLDYWDVLAETEGQVQGAKNRLTVEDGGEHLFVLDRPTTIGEYEPKEYEALRKVVGEPRQFFAVDYTDRGLLLRVLRVLLRTAGERQLVVEDSEGRIAFLEDYLRVSRST